jgi:predicted nucleotidyltransferase
MLYNAEKLRLDAQQRMALEEALRDVHGIAYLFGSRVNAHARGGDVDVLVINEDEDKTNLELILKITRSYQQLCDERIDVTVYPVRQKQSQEQKDFFNHIQKVRIK